MLCKVTRTHRAQTGNLIMSFKREREGKSAHCHYLAREMDAPPRAEELMRFKPRPKAKKSRCKSTTNCNSFYEKSQNLFSLFIRSDSAVLAEFFPSPSIRLLAQSRIHYLCTNCVHIPGPGEWRRNREGASERERET